LIKEKEDQYKDIENRINKIGGSKERQISSRTLINTDQQTPLIRDELIVS
jgi:hypothetical protein